MSNITADITLDSMNAPVAEMRLPELVREFTARKCDGARGVMPTRAQHERLGRVVDELRRRGALD